MENSELLNGAICVYDSLQISETRVEEQPRYNITTLRLFGFL